VVACSNSIARRKIRYTNSEYGQYFPILSIESRVVPTCRCITKKSALNVALVKNHKRFV